MTFDARRQPVGSLARERLHARLDGRAVDRNAVDVATRGRLRWLRHCLDELGERPERMLVFGWDHGCTASESFANLRIRSLTTVDLVRERSLLNELRSADGKATYVHVDDFRASESADLAFTHGVLDRMTDSDRMAVSLLVYRSLKPGGLFAVWQENSWTTSAALGAPPIPVSDHGRSVTPRHVRRVLQGAGFDIVNTTSSILFPDALAWCQPLAPLLAPITLGRQYMVLARKP